MKVKSSYPVKLLSALDLLKQTADVYRQAVAFFIDCINKEWNIVAPVYKKSKNNTVTLVESFTHITKSHPNVKYDFDTPFYKMPAYFRRSAIRAAAGAVSSYRSALANWEESDQTTKCPTLTVDRDVMPAFFRNNMSRIDDMLSGKTDIVELKLFKNKDWV